MRSLLPTAITALSALAPRSAPVSLSATGDVWLNHWYPACFSASVKQGSLVPATIFERPLVLWRDESGSVSCLKDECPHRLAPLSDGRIAMDEDSGTLHIECSYHGWQFATCGRCTRLPQLESCKPILRLYDASAYPVAESQGIVYVFMGHDVLLAKRI